MQRIFNWTRKRRDVTLEFDGGYMGNPSTMCITMRYKPQPHRVRQIVTDLSVEALEEDRAFYDLLNDMYKVLMSNVDDMEQARKRGSR